MSKWTQDDENAFLVMQERRQAVIDARKHEVREVAEGLAGFADSWQLSHSLIDNATKVRKVLESFDPTHPNFCETRKS